MVQVETSKPTTRPQVSRSKERKHEGKAFATGGKFLVLKLFRLGHTPPALYTSQMLAEGSFPLLVAEFGYRRERKKELPGPVNKIRIAARWTRLLPRPLPAAAIFLNAFFVLAYRFLKEGRPKVLIAEGLQEEILALLLHLTFRVPLVCQVNEVYKSREVDRLTRFFLKFEGHALRRSEFLLFPEKTRESIYRRRYHYKCPVYFVFNCPRLQRDQTLPRDLRKELHLNPGTVLLAYFGGIGPTNALEEAIVSLIEVPQVHLLLWGWGDHAYLESLKLLAKQCRLSDRVHFLGELGKSKWEVLRSCDLSYCVYRPNVLRLKHAATASNKLFESMAAGLPVITSGQPDFKEIVQKLEIGVCATHISSGAVAQALRVLVQDPARRKAMGEQGRRYHQSAYHFEYQFKEAGRAFANLT